MHNKKTHCALVGEVHWGPVWDPAGICYPQTAAQDMSGPSVSDQTSVPPPANTQRRPKQVKSLSNRSNMTTCLLVLTKAVYLFHYHTDPWTGSAWWDSSVLQKFTPGWFSVCLRCLKRHQREKASLSFSTTLFLGHSLKLPTGKYIHLNISDDNKAEF